MQHCNNATHTFSWSILYLHYALTMCTTVQIRNLNYLMNRLLHLLYVQDPQKTQFRTGQTYNPKEIPCRFKSILQSIQFKLEASYHFVRTWHRRSMSSWFFFFKTTLFNYISMNSYQMRPWTPRMLKNSLKTALPFNSLWS